MKNKREKGWVWWMSKGEMNLKKKKKRDEICREKGKIE